MAQCGPLLVCDDRRLAGFHNGDRGVGGTQINADNLSHVFKNLSFVGITINGCREEPWTTGAVTLFRLACATGRPLHLGQCTNRANRPNPGRRAAESHREAGNLHRRHADRIRCPARIPSAGQYIVITSQHPNPS